MNYLSHYYVDAQSGRHYFNFGLALPDLVGATQRGWRASNEGYPWDGAHEVRDIWQGYQHHISADAYFHSSDFFKDNTLAIRHIFEHNELRFPGVRLFFVAHVFLEMMIDRIIILEHPGIAEQFYHGLDTIGTHKVSHFFEASSSTVPPRFFDLFDKFREHKFLYSYTVDEKLFYALNRIMGRAKQEAFNEEHIPAFSRAIKETESLLYKQYQGLFNDIKAHRDKQQILQA